MSSSCIIKEFPIPEREYRVSPPGRWDGDVSRRPAPRGRARSRRRQRRSARLAPLFLAGLALFACGFLLGRAAAFPQATDIAKTSAAGGGPSIQPEEPAASAWVPGTGQTPAVRILSSVGSVFLGEQEGSSSRETGTAPVVVDWNLILVNGEHPLSQDFSVPELTQLKNGHAIDSRVYPSLQAMMDAARGAGYEPLICSSFRTWDKQAELFERKVSSCMDQAADREEAEALAAVWVARPGASEHQAGLAVDIVDKGYQLLDQAQEDRPVQQWLMEHCAEYGFILRYPTDKSALTGVGYEPWHYRYVGEEAAKAIMDGGLCLEEYLPR